jgi:RNA polymerase sigma-70 factor, ECF subfamily
MGNHKNNSYNISINNLDIKGFELLFKEYYSPLCHHCMQFVRDRANAEDIVQDLFLKLWIKRHELKIDTSIKSYLYASVRFNAIHFLKSRFSYSERNDLSVLENEDNSNDLMSNIEFEEFRSLVTKAISSLPEKCHIIFSLSRYGDMTYQEIAMELNISVKTVETQMSIALKKIRNFLEKHRNM